MLDALNGAHVFDLRVSAAERFEACTVRADPEHVVDPARCTSTADTGALTRLSGVSAELRGTQRSDTSTDVLWATALIDMLGAPTDAATQTRVIGHLTEVVARRPDDALALSHLAVAHVARAAANDDARDLFAALERIEAAFQLDSLSPVILANRAAILDRLRLDRLAIRAWRRAAERDRSDWVAADTTRAARLASQAASDIQSRRLVAHAAASDPGIATAAGSHAQMVRSWAMDSLVPRWARAVLAEQPALADSTRTLIAVFGSALAASNGDSSTLHFAAELASASRAPAVQIRTAHAIETAAAGLALFNATQFALAYDTLRASEAAFARVDAPVLAAWSRLPLGAIAIYRGKYAEAERLFLAIADVGRRRNALALRGRALWGLGLSQTRRGIRSDLAGTIVLAIEIFSRLGERPNLGFLRSMLAEHYAALGRKEQQARAMLSALEELHASDEYTRRHLVLLTQGQELAADGLLRAAADFTREAEDQSHLSGVPKDVPEALIRLAWVEAQQHDAVNALRHLAAARASMSRVTDPLIRTRLDAEFARAEGAALGLVDARQAAARMDSVVAYFERVGIRDDVASSHIRRADLRLALSDSAGAEQDLAAANSEVLREVTSRTSRYEMRDIARQQSEVFRRRVVLALARGDTAAALEHFLRARSDTVRGAGESGAARATPTRAVATTRGTAVVSYLVLDDRLLIWSTRDGRVALRSVPVSKRALGDRTARFVNLVRLDGDARTMATVGRALYETLLAPVADQISGATALVIEADRELLGVPFAALPTPGGALLIERSAIVYAERRGAALRDTVTDRRRAALLVGDPMFDRTLFSDLPALRMAGREVDDVGPLYAGAVLLRGSAASKRALRASLTGRSLLHFAGHARVVSDAPATSFLVLAKDGAAFDTNVLTAAEIEGLSLPQLRTVILSACGDTRPSGVAASENALVRAFLDAGAREVVVSQWEADDAGSSSLMRVLHQQLRDGVPIGEALRRAQLALLRARDTQGGGAIPLRVWATFRVEVREAGEE